MAWTYPQGMELWQMTPNERSTLERLLDKWEDLGRLMTDVFIAKFHAQL